MSSWNNTSSRPPNCEVADSIRRTLERLVKPYIGELGLYELRRSDVARMLDKIADKHGPVMADRTLAHRPQGV